ncbi:cyclic peptide export ABC transporter [Acanthopleuribacter pedis]|uniref:Cyclic peptide export ABC transporter n=1 Tax=Acanthopleuribacter pedis TaxID=442870 RepID=A0A8J7U3Q1_9BACT|nr:cyclic peptide export ABC transporter [Acanthopleuribacter pedis]MBO1317496.1 cyclic peptide export ABC transporter [Acanthopleuribacter pedis]
MKMWLFLKQQLGARIYLVALLSLMTGVCNTLMIKTINDVIHGGVNGGRMAVFAAAIVGYLAASRFFSAALLRATQRAVFTMRAEILGGVLACDQQRFEQVPNQAIYTAITEDTTQLARSPDIISSMLIAGFTILVCFAYLCWLSPVAFVLILLCILVGAGLYSSVAGRAARDWFAARQTQDEFFRLVDHQLRGFKELKMSDEKRREFFENHLMERCRAGYEQNVRGGEQYIQAVLVSGMLIYGVLGAFAFTGQTWLGLSAEPFASTILVMLYLTPAIQQTVDLLPTLDRFGIAIDKMEKLQRDLADKQTPGSTSVALAEGNAPKFTNWHCLRLARVTFAYPPVDGAEPFHIGPLDLEVRRGEVLFIVGGNGSGKTTLLKLLLGLYKPDSGRFTVDGQAWEAGGADQRHLFSPLFADFHLFDRIYGRQPSPEDLANHLSAMALDHKVNLADGAWSTLDLSQGQRKRLGLVQALVDPAPVLVMDEFAADQDPAFRRRFYRELIPMFRAAGKTIIAITHDESYFDCADRIIHMVEGRPEEHQPQAAEALLT